MDMQNVSKLVIPEGEVRTIHDKDSNLLWGRLTYDTKYAGDTVQDDTPSPDTPVPVQVVTGEQTVTVMGKNLFDKDIPLSKDYVNATGGWTTSSTPSYINQEYDSITGGTTFQFSFPSRVGSATVRFAEYDAAGTFIKRTLIDTQTSLTTNVNTAKIIFSVDAYSTRHFDNLQIEIGLTATTPYEAYKSTSYTVNLGSLELAKIGTYQDYIYKSGDDWYVHKETSKVILNGLESWDGSNSKYNYSSADVIVQPLTQDAPIVAMSAYLTASNYWAISNNLADNIIAGYYNGGQIRVRVTSFATVTDWKTWLSNHNMTVYYILDTPTDAQITDATLIPQLDAIHQFLTRYGYSATVSGNLPIIIDRTTL